MYIDKNKSNLKMRDTHKKEFEKALLRLLLRIKTIKCLYSRFAYFAADFGD